VREVEEGRHCALVTVRADAEAPAERVLAELFVPGRASTAEPQDGPQSGRSALINDRLMAGGWYRTERLPKGISMTLSTHEDPRIVISALS
jgi:hypothetical protein